MAEPLKLLYSKAFIEKLASTIKTNYPSFKTKPFVSAVLNDEWESLELKQRMRHITNCMHRFLPVEYPEQISILMATAPSFSGFLAMIFPDFVEVYGLNDYQTSVSALAHFTCYSSSEFAVRPFLVKYTKAMLKQHLQWSKHPNHHIRRLASEGIRPRLPWAMALPEFKKNPTPILPVLENLKADSSEYVRRSVANCLNDISKDHPDVVIGIIKQWKNEGPETQWIIKHASRGLLKKGHTEALSTFGLNHKANIDVNTFNCTHKTLRIGESFYFEAAIKLKEKKAHDLRLEYRIYFMKANGKTAPKIFQIGTWNVKAGEVCSVKRKHHFADLTTRKHYPGKHQLVLVVNGREVASLNFELKP